MLPILPTLPTFDQLLVYFDNANYNVRLFKFVNPIKHDVTEIMGKHGEQNSGPSIVKSVNPNVLDNTSLYLTSLQCSLTGSHITIRRDTWDAHKLIHITIYFVEGYDINECANWYIVTNDFQLNEVPLNHTRPFTVESLPNTLPRFLYTTRDSCLRFYQNQIPSINPDFAINTYDFGQNSPGNVQNILEHIRDNFIIKISQVRQEVLNEQVRRETLALARQRALDEQARQRALDEQVRQRTLALARQRVQDAQARVEQERIDEREREREREEEQEQYIYGSKKRHKVDDEQFGGSNNYKHKYLKYKKKYMDLKKLNI